MKKVVLFFSIFLFLFITENTFAQKPSWVIGGRFGISVASSVAGLQIGPMAEIKFNRNMAAGTEFNINTQAGTPIEWANYFKYYIDVRGSNIKPYVDGGFSLFFLTGGPYFGIRFGGGVNIPVAPRISIPADLQLGPVFASGTSVFYFAITSGIRYELP